MCHTAAMRRQVLIGQLTDTHLVDPDGDTELFVDNNGRMRTAVARLNAEDPPVAAVLGTGDLTNDHEPRAYDVLAEIVADLDAPFLPLGGNHDDRPHLRATFPDVGWTDADHLSWDVTVQGVRLVGLDSTRPGAHGGEVDAERIRWLDDRLAERHDGPTILALHHPPFESGIWWMDQYGFAGLDALAEVLRARPVDRIVCGHLHRPMVSSFAGIPAIVAMSTVQHVELDLRGRGAGDVAIIRDPVGYQLHRVVVDGDGSTIVTHARYLDTGEAPIVPDWAPEFRADG